MIIDKIPPTKWEELKYPDLDSKRAIIDRVIIDKVNDIIEELGLDMPPGRSVSRLAIDRNEMGATPQLGGSKEELGLDKGECPCDCECNETGEHCMWCKPLEDTGKTIGVSKEAMVDNPNVTGLEDLGLEKTDGEMRKI